ncbi:hypothetical protein HID58_066190 [Brassica napus]|uniref:Uncharacterized protein n=1 Tax=Brassica napus TaxID=3708 RepID=A0ABQ7ZFE9_BRANA|nr:hypothetical protein HID58_066190 [Brassica napus]
MGHFIELGPWTFVDPLSSCVPESHCTGFGNGVKSYFTLDIPLPHKNSDGYIPHLGDELGYPLEVRKHNVNQKQQAKKQPLRSKLMNYARGRWNPLINPSSYTLSPVYEAATRTIDENAPTTTTKADTEEVDSREVVLPGLNLLYVGSELHPFDIGACLQARQLVAQIADATDASAILSP